MVTFGMQNLPVGIKSHTQVERRNVFTHKECFLSVGEWLIMTVLLIWVPQCPHLIWVPQCPQYPQVIGAL